MLRSGLVSVTFRGLDVRSVVALVTDAGLDTIEWAADVHVRPGVEAEADLGRDLCADVGLEISSYGSYYRAGVDPPQAFAPVLESARRLGAPAIRIWAGHVGSARTGPRLRRQVVDDVAAAANAAAGHGIRVNLEHHPKTLTDTVESTLTLLASVAASRGGASLPVGTYYQPHRATPPSEACGAVDALREHLTSVHVFSWDAEGRRLPLEEREDLWTEVLSRLAQDGRDHDLLLEFVRGDDPAQFVRDAAVLRDWIQQTPP